MFGKLYQLFYFLSMFSFIITIVMFLYFSTYKLRTKKELKHEDHPLWNIYGYGVYSLILFIGLTFIFFVFSHQGA